MVGGLCHDDDDEEDEEEADGVVTLYRNTWKYVGGRETIEGGSRRPNGAKQLNTIEKKSNKVGRLNENTPLMGSQETEAWDLTIEQGIQPSIQQV